MVFILSHQENADQMTLRFHLTPIRMAKIKTQVTEHAAEDVEQGEHYFVASGHANLYNYSGNQFGSISENWR